MTASVQVPGTLFAHLDAAVARHNRAVAGFFDAHAGDLEELAEHVIECFAQGGKLMFCGNGGSACDAMHIAGEFVGRFKRERSGLAAIALSADSGVLTAIGNDYGFERIFSRQVEALGLEHDILFALSTSGASANVLQALEAARAEDIRTVLMTGEKGRGRAEHADHLLVVPDLDTARVQETHMLALHILADMVETVLFLDNA